MVPSGLHIQRAPSKPQDMIQAKTSKEACFPERLKVFFSFLSALCSEDGSKTRTVSQFVKVSWDPKI